MGRLAFVVKVASRQQQPAELRVGGRGGGVRFADLGIDYEFGV